METPVFAVIGHGNEEPVEFNERPPVPPGYKVVLLTKPGQPFSELNASYLWKKMVSEPNLFENPIAAKHEIETDNPDDVQFRIYEEGAPMPDMRFYPNSFFRSERESKILLAGIYRLPLPFPSLHTGSKSGLGTATSIITEEDINTLYSGDENRQIRADILARFGVTSRIYEIAGLVEGQPEFSYTIEEVLAMNGPGVYYFFNCRYVKGLQKKLDGFLGRLYLDIQKTKDKLELEMPEVPFSKNTQAIRELWFTRWFIANQEISAFKNRLKELEGASSMLPEDKLRWLRNILLEGSLLPENNSLRGKPSSNNNIRAFMNNYKQLKGPEKGFHLTVFNKQNILAELKRRHLALYDEEFGSLFRHLPMTRQKSSVGQEKYTRKGGKRKGRKTRRRN